MQPAAPTISIARPADIAALRGFDELGADERRWARIELAIGAERCAAASAGGVPAGFAVWVDDWFGHPFIELVVVAPSHRRRGIGTALVRWVTGRVRADRVFTSTNESNAAMRRLLEREGFIPAGTIGYLDEGDPEVVYVKIGPGPSR